MRIGAYPLGAETKHNYFHFLRDHRGSKSGLPRIVQGSNPNKRGSPDEEAYRQTTQASSFCPKKTD